MPVREGKVVKRTISAAVRRAPCRIDSGPEAQAGNPYRGLRLLWRSCRDHHFDRRPKYYRHIFAHLLDKELGTSSRPLMPQLSGALLSYCLFSLARIPARQHSLRKGATEKSSLYRCSYRVSNVSKNDLRDQRCTHWPQTVPERVSMISASTTTFCASSSSRHSSYASHNSPR